MRSKGQRSSSLGMKM